MRLKPSFDPGTVFQRTMGDFFAALIELIGNIWGADTELRNRSIAGESEFDRDSRRFVAKVCGGAIAVVILAAIAWWCLTQGRHR